MVKKRVNFVESTRILRYILIVCEYPQFYWCAMLLASTYTVLLMCFGSKRQGKLQSIYPNSIIIEIEFNVRIYRSVGKRCKNYF